MDDLISRQAAIDAECEVCQIAPKRERGHNCNYYVHGCKEIECIRALQSAQQWIPCSERLPEDDTLMLVNYIDHRPDAVDIWIGWHEMENVWYIDGEAHSREFDNEVIAWMPLPEPYKGEES